MDSMTLIAILVLGLVAESNCESTNFTCMLKGKINLTRNDTKEFDLTAHCLQGTKLDRTEKQTPLHFKFIFRLGKTS